MKTLKLSFATVIVLFGLFMTLPAVAKVAPVQYGEDQSIMSLSPQPTSTDGPTYGNTTVQPLSDITPSKALSASSQSLNGNQDHLPINNGIVFLLIAGLAIGTKLALNGTRKPAYQ